MSLFYTFMFQTFLRDFKTSLDIFLMCIRKDKKLTNLECLIHNYRCLIPSVLILDYNHNKDMSFPVSCIRHNCLSRNFDMSRDLKLAKSLKERIDLLYPQ